MRIQLTVPSCYWEIYVPEEHAGAGVRANVVSDLFVQSIIDDLGVSGSVEVSFSGHFLTSMKTTSVLFIDSFAIPVG